MVGGWVVHSGLIDKCLQQHGRTVLWVTVAVVRREGCEVRCVIESVSPVTKHNTVSVVSFKGGKREGAKSKRSLQKWFRKGTLDKSGGCRRMDTFKD